tara:strand:- start:37150 stop:38010 length:861 start_codon:yes stop_codon:yes gene_type:complete
MLNIFNKKEKVELELTKGQAKFIDDHYSGDIALFMEEFVTSIKPEEAHPEALYTLMPRLPYKSWALGAGLVVLIALAYNMVSFTGPAKDTLAANFETTQSLEREVAGLEEQVRSLKRSLRLEAEAGVALQARVSELTAIDPDALKKLRSLLLSPRLLNNRNKTTGATPMFRLFRHSMPTEEYKNYVQRAIHAGGDINQPRFAFDNEAGKWISEKNGHNILQFLVRDGQAHKALWAVENFGGWDFMYTNFRGASLLDIVESEIILSRDRESEHYASLLKLRNFLTKN